MASAAGRSFLQEYLRRNRSDETVSLLMAIRRIEGLLTTRSLEPDPAGIDTSIETGIETTITTAADVSNPEISVISQSEAIVIEGDAWEAGPAPGTAQNGAFTAEIAQTEIVVAEIDGVSVEIAECQASAIEYPAPQLPDSAAPVDAAAPAERIKTDPRDPFADFYALSSEEKIALFT